MTLTAQRFAATLTALLALVIAPLLGPGAARAADGRSTTASLVLSRTNVTGGDNIGVTVKVRPATAKRKVTLQSKWKGWSSLARTRTDRHGRAHFTIETRTDPGGPLAFLVLRAVVAPSRGHGPATTRTAKVVIIAGQAACPTGGLTYSANVTVVDHSTDAGRQAGLRNPYATATGRLTNTSTETIQLSTTPRVTLNYISVLYLDGPTVIRPGETVTLLSQETMISDYLADHPPAAATMDPPLARWEDVMLLAPGCAAPTLSAG